MELVERASVLQVLEDRLRSVAFGGGHTALISGEAGIGKTSLLNALAERRADATLWWGACDALQTPHPLAPLHDIARSSEVGFRSLLSAPKPVASGQAPHGEQGRAPLFESVLRELQQSRRPTLFVVEDVHWADDATLDLLKFLGRRIDRAPCLLVISYRDDELTPTHPLRLLTGELPASLVTRIEMQRLSPEGVARLANRALQSPAGVYAASHGNPFFVTEILRYGIQGVPRGVQDLVLARYARLEAQAQAIVRLASVVPAQIERWLVETLLGANVAAIGQCLHSGLLSTADSTLRFRHELARAAIESSLSEPEAQAIHAQVLEALEREEHRMTVSLARLVHHATKAGDSAAVLRHAPRAAQMAMERGAHREAAAHYRTALHHATLIAGVSDAQLIAWNEAYASECQLTDQLNEAIAARLQLGALHRRADDILGEARNLSHLAIVYVLALRNREADDASLHAIGLLEALPPSVHLAAAYRVEAQLRGLSRDFDASLAWGTKAMHWAEQFDDVDIIAAARATLGAAMTFVDYQPGCDYLLQALAFARDNGLHYIAANVYSNLGTASGELFHLHEAQRYLGEGISFATRHEIDFYRNYCVAWLALCEMYLGCWEDAGDHAMDIVSHTTHRTTSRVMALVALGRLRARRGDPGIEDVLDEALALALSTGTLQRIAPVRLARAEAAYLRGDLAAVELEARSALALATARRHGWFIGEMAYWLRRAGTPDEAPAGCAPPFALQLAGQWREAAQAWSTIGCPYEQARALSEGDAEARLEAMVLFEQLGARPAADALRKLLRASGSRGVPRGARASTQNNPHQLTARELEVLHLLCEGMKNSEIAERLVRSVRTVDHHVAAILGKLGVSSRNEAMAAAQRAGIGARDGHFKTTR